MGNSESSNPLKNLDKRTARREYREAFSAAIHSYRESFLNKRQGTESLEWQDGSIQVFVRKRPLFKHELDNYEFDVVTACPGNNRRTMKEGVGYPDRTKVIVHDARMHTDMLRQFMNHNEFEFDRVFDENADNATVYSSTAKSLVDITLQGGFSTCMVYGQTGSGKTFTMTSIYENAARDLFSNLRKEVQRFEEDEPTVTMSFFEVAGDSCSDLLNGFRHIQLLTGYDANNVYAFPIVEVNVTTEEELLAMIHHGINVRTTAATGVHDASSRSHAVLKIYVQRHDLTRRRRESSSSSSADGLIEGTLTLVDLAGSEHRIDSMYHGKERRKETGQINASLMALKDCIRQRAASKNLSHQYRKSKLTMALKASFSLPTARTIVIATVSPASKDTEHSLNTLRHACMMHGQQDGEEGAPSETRFVVGGTVKTVQVGEVNLTQIARQNQALKKNGKVSEGLKSSNGNKADSKVSKASNQEVELTDKEKARMRRQAEQRSMAKMDPICKEMLVQARKMLGSNSRQIIRIRGRMEDMTPVPDEEEDCIHTVDDADDQGYENASVEEVYEEDFDVPVQKASPPAGKKSNHYDREEFTRDEAPPASVHSARTEEPVHVNAFKTAEFHNIYRALYKDCASLSKDIRVIQLTNLLKLLCYSAGEISCLLQSIEVESVAASDRPTELKNIPNSGASSMAVTSQTRAQSRDHLQKQVKPQSAESSFFPSGEVVAAVRSKVVHSPEVQQGNRVDDTRDNGRRVQDTPQPSRDKPSQQQQKEIQIQQQQQQLLLQKQLAAEEKDKRRVEGIAKAALELEQQAALRKARHDAAREKLQQSKTRSVAAPASSYTSSSSTSLTPGAATEGPPKSASYQNTGHAPAAKVSEISASERQKLKQLRDQVVQVERQKLDPHSSSTFGAGDPKIAFHEGELNRLLGELEADNQLSAAAIHGIRKNIAVHKASLLKERQRIAERSQSMRSNSASAGEIDSYPSYNSQQYSQQSPGGFNEHQLIRNNSSGLNSANQRNPSKQSSHNGGEDREEDRSRNRQHVQHDFGDDVRNSPHGGVSGSNHGPSFLDRERERMRRLGAAAAPFCNDYSWQPDEK